jgi:hypothetical protein
MCGFGVCGEPEPIPGPAKDGCKVCWVTCCGSCQSRWNTQMSSDPQRATSTCHIQTCKAATQSLTCMLNISGWLNMWRALVRSEVNTVYSAGAWGVHFLLRVWVCAHVCACCRLPRSFYLPVVSGSHSSCLVGAQMVRVGSSPWLCFYRDQAFRIPGLPRGGGFVHMCSLWWEGAKFPGQGLRIWHEKLCLVALDLWAVTVSTPQRKSWHPDEPGGSAGAEAVWGREDSACVWLFFGELGLSTGCESKNHKSKLSMSVKDPSDRWLQDQPLLVTLWHQEATCVPGPCFFPARPGIQQPALLSLGMWEPHAFLLGFPWRAGTSAKWAPGS